MTKKDSLERSIKEHANIWEELASAETRIDLSIVFGTYNRLASLVACIASARKSAAGYKHEFVICDGGSTDGTLEYLRAQPDVVLIEHGELRGPVKAYNDCFAKCRGRYVAHLNDDLIVNGSTLADSVMVLDGSPDVGQLVFRYDAAKYHALGNRYLYAAFGMTRREIGDATGWYGDYYYYCGDIHLSLNVHKAGYRVEFAPGSVEHGYAPNAVRGDGNGWHRHVPKKEDWAKFDQTWRSYDG